MLDGSKREGFPGEKLIVLPPFVVASFMGEPLSSRVYPTDVGYFPRASCHYRNRVDGCAQHILLCCFEGAGVIQMGRRQIPLKAGQAFCIPPLAPHRYWADEREPWSLLWLHFTGSEVSLYPVERAEVVNLGPPKDQEEVKALFSMLFGTLEGAHTSGNLVHAATLTETILSAIFFREKGRGWEVGNSIFTKAIRYMHNRLAEPLTLNDIVSYTMVSKSYLHTLFNRYTSCSPMEYFYELKIQEACRLLEMTDLQVQEIATMLGYSEVGYFSRRFKQRVKMSPRTYRSASKLPSDGQGHSGDPAVATRLSRTMAPDDPECE